MSAAVAAGTVALVAQEAQPLGAFTPFAYAACLLFSLFGMLMLDWRHRLFWFADARRSSCGMRSGSVWECSSAARPRS